MICISVSFFLCFIVTVHCGIFHFINLYIFLFFKSNRQELYSLMDLNKEGLRTIEEVEQGLQHIIADVISKDPQVLDCVRQL